MAIPATQMRPGMIIKHNDQLHLVFKVGHSYTRQPARVHSGKTAEYQDGCHV